MVPTSLFIRAVRKGRVFQLSDPDRWDFPPGSSTPVSPAFALVGFVGLALLVCATDSALAGGVGRRWFLSLARPAGTPPGWLFVSGWGVTLALMGVGGWLVWRQSISTRPLRLWGWQLAVSALWAPAFFGLHRPLFGLAALMALIALVALTIQRFARIDRVAASLLLPYLLWTSYSLYLSVEFCWLNWS